MKMVTVTEAQHHLAELLRTVVAGEEIAVVRNKKPVAKIVPIRPRRTKINWADTWSKVNAIFGEQPLAGKPGSRIVAEGRR
ncbi:MAG: type II toxin-antitoxin system prevent-host-death family antitoxin [Verrucomicrobia bacterium]|nr:type II toxin-antitoxin system prevent-host-death family antitoxin [Verrucomicrobiota bacterium]